MIIVAEGPSAAGKTSWVQNHYADRAVWEHQPSGAGPDRVSDPHGAAQFWAEANARRWQQALELEVEHELAVCDTDPFKLHYVWSLWYCGEVPLPTWKAEAEISRRMFEAGRIGLADVVFCALPDPAQLRRRKNADTGRPRRNFELHVRLGEALRLWYTAVDDLDPGRVVWNLSENPQAVDLPPLRPDRSAVSLFDQLVSSLPDSRNSRLATPRRP